VFIAIQENDFVQYPPPMKSGTNTRNINKLCPCHLDHHYDTKKYNVLKKEIERLISKGYL